MQLAVGAEATSKTSALVSVLLLFGVAVVVALLGVGVVVAQRTVGCSLNGITSFVCVCIYWYHTLLDHQYELL